jgi:bifunctional isochorismate lyase / aryl carrier protein
MRSEPYVTPESIDRMTGKWLAAVEGSARPRPWLRIDPPRCALIVTDMQRYFASRRGRAYLPATEAVIPRIVLLLGEWRRLGAPVAFTLHCHGDADDLGMLGRFFRDHIRCGEEDSLLIPELSPAPDEPVFTKSTYDAFRGTGLEGFLRGAGATQVLVAGALTQLCCETTARAAFVLGFEVYIAADATATSTEALHLGSLIGLASGVAVVTDSASILSVR